MGMVSNEGDGHDGGASVGGQSRVSRSNKDKQLAKKETHVVNILRLSTLAVLIVVAAAVSSLVYVITRQGERDAFESHFFSLAHKLTDDILKAATKQLTTLHGLSLSYTSHGIETNSSFPFATLPDIEIRGRNVIETANIIGFATAAIVKDQDRDAWLQYAEANKGWLAQGLALQEAISDVDDATSRDHLLGLVSSLDLAQYSSSSQLTPFFFKLNEKGVPEIVTTPGTVAPFWQMCPALPLSEVINYDLLSQANHRASMESVIMQKKSFIGGAADFSIDDPATAGEAEILNLFLNRWDGLRDRDLNYEGGPVSAAYIPVFNKFGSDREVASIVVAYIYWQTLLTGSLPDGEDTGLFIVLENTCDQAYTYRVDGSEATYVGSGDLHERQYDGFLVETGFGVVTGNNEGDGACQYNARVYPTTKLEDAFVSWNPVIMTVIVVSVFLFTSLLFVTYDNLVQRRHKVVNKRAVQSTAVVESLFPSAVRDRVSSIYAPDEEEPELKLASSRLFDINEDVAYHGDGVSCESGGSDPIADTYDDCTVLVGEIVGFSWWSASQPPSKVFMLLETVYCAFDKLAAMHGVFKVETIAESYVAVAGVPQPQVRHAVVMSRFAHACVIKFEQLLPKLAELFGDETFDLSFRAGLHSGPVTAGVLRGEKARFQLFGETVNMAATMKNSSELGRIHVSRQTYTLLKDAGKYPWLTPRETKVYSSIHGELQTYWVKPPASELGVSESSYGSESNYNAEGSRSLCRKSPTVSSHSTASNLALANTGDYMESGDLISELSNSTSHLDAFFSFDNANRQYRDQNAPVTKNLQRSYSASSADEESTAETTQTEPSTHLPRRQLSRTQTAMLNPPSALPNQESSGRQAAAPPKQPRRSYSPEKSDSKRSAIHFPRHMCEELSPPVTISKS